MVLPGMKPTYTEDPKRHSETRLPGFGWLPNRARHLFVACLGEFVGTFLFLFFAFAATQVANNLLGTRPMNIETLMYISLSFGFSLAVNVWIFFRISGGLFNPAVGSSHIVGSQMHCQPLVNATPRPWAILRLDATYLWLTLLR